jgi:Domain of unknown function (DUF4864)
MRKQLIILVLLGGVGWWFWGRTLEPVRVIRAQLEAIDKGNYTQAYDYLSPVAKKQLTVNDFVALVRATSVVSKNYASTFLSRKVENNVATISGTLQGFEGQVREVRYILVKEGDRWMIQSFTWSPPPTTGEKQPGSQ